MKNRNIWYLIVVCALTSFFHTAVFAPAMSLSERDAQALGLGEAETKEFEEFLNALNNLPPEQMEEINKLSQELATQMKDKNLDPENLADVRKFSEELVGDLAPEKELDFEKELTMPISPETRKSTEPEKPVRLINDPKDATKLIESTIAKLSSVRQKAAFIAPQKLERYNQELNELVYFLYVIQSPDLIKLLVTAEFKQLYDSLEKLHTALITHEPRIEHHVIIEDLDNPYTLLRVPLTATQDDIEDAYATIKAEYDPEILRDNLKAAGVEGKLLDKRLKASRLQLQFVADAYDQLVDPMQRKVVDKQMQDKMRVAQSKENQSVSAISAITQVLSNEMYKILRDIRSLLAKYKPQELEKAKKQQEIEKAAAAESSRFAKKSIKKSESLFGSAERQDKPYKDFYASLKKESGRGGGYRPDRDFFKRFDDGKSKDGAKDGGDGKKGDGKKPGGGKKPDGKKDGDKKDKKDEKKKEEGKSSKGGDGGKDSSKDASKELPAQVVIDEIGNMLKKAADEIEIEVAAPKAEPVKRGIPISDEDEIKEISLADLEGEVIPEEPKKKKIKVSAIQDDLKKYFSQPPAAPTRKPDSTNQLALEKAIVKNLVTFTKENKVKEVWEKLVELEKMTQKGKLKSKELIKSWNDKVVKYKKTIESWKKFADLLDTDQRKKLSPSLGTNAAKLKLHGLDVSKTSKGKKPKGEPLADVRKYYKEIAQIFDRITKASK